MTLASAELERSHAPITSVHLEHLRNIAERELDALFARRPKHSGAFRDQLLLLTLAQGAASHMVLGKKGIKDFDVWAFFRRLPGKRFPPRTRLKADFGLSEHGRHPSDPMRWTGRRVDVLGRDISIEPGEAPEHALGRYLDAPKTTTASLLANQPVIGLWPERLFGQLLWKGR
jgi:hypothetical protein